MSDQIPPESEQKNASDLGSPLADGAGTGGAGYGGAGYGYGGPIAGDSEFGFVHYLQIVYRRRYIVTTVFLAVVLSAALYTFTAVRVYEGTAQILIERVNPNVVSFQ